MADEERAIINKSRGRTFKQLENQFGQDTAAKIIHDRTQKWRTQSWSEISKELFTVIEHKIKKKCFYAENEKQFIINDKIYYADFYDGEKFIIEFMGSIWHADPKCSRQMISQIHIMI